MKEYWREKVSEKGHLRSWHFHKEPETLRVVGVGLMIIFLHACQTLGTDPTPVELAKREYAKAPEISANRSPSGGYLIQSGDVLSVKFYFNSELNEEDLVVRPDGHISLQLVHEVKAAGRTPIELKKILNKKYSTHLNNPEIAVIVRSIKAPKKIYVGGYVRQPGEFEMVGSMTVLQAIALAQGMQPTASHGDVLVIRRSQNNDPSTIWLNLKDALTGDDLSQDISLRPYDYVYVPESFW